MQTFSFRKKVLFFIGGLLFSISSLQATSFKLIPSLSKVTWKATKVLGGHTGTVKFQEGSLELKDGRPTGGHFKVDMKSIVDLDLDPAGRWNKILVDHLKSEDFFSAEKNPFYFNVENRCGNCGKPSIKNVYKEVFSRTFDPTTKPLTAFFVQRKGFNFVPVF